MAEWHRRLDGREFEQVAGDGEGQGSLACSSLWGRRVGHDSTAKQQQLSCVSRGGVFRAASGPLRWWALRSGTGSCSVNTCR